MPFFRLLETVLKGSRDRVNWENLNANAIALDERKIDLLQDILHKSTEAVLVGPRDSGKTVTAQALGFKALTRSGLVCFYGNVRDLVDITEAVREIQAYESFSARTLFILEDCHTSTNLMKVETLLQRLGRERRNTALLLTTRHLEAPDSILRAIGQEGGVVRLTPEELRANIARKHIEQLRRQPTYANSPYFPKQETDVEAQISGLLARLPQKNLRMLDIYLQAWDPCTEPLDKVEERQVLQMLLTRATPPMTSPEAQVCFLPLCAIDQYEVGVHMNFFNDRNTLQQLKDSGIIHCSDCTGLCRLPDPSEAPWYLKAAEQARLLQVEGRPTNVAAYVRHHILGYAAVAPNPQDLLRALHDDEGLAQAVIQDSRFLANISRLAPEPLFRADLPDLFFELRMLNNIDLCLTLSQSLTDSDLNDIGRIGVDNLDRYLVEFLSWGQEGLRLAQRLMSQESVQPGDLAIEFMTGLGEGRYGVADLATLVFKLNGLKTYDVCGLLNSLDLPRLRTKFPETRLIRYAALLRHVKWAKCGTRLVRELTPAIEAILPRVRGGSARNLRDMMDALLMPRRKQLWKELSDQDLREIIDRSTLNQFYNFLEDALESKNQESRELGKEISTRLVNLDLSVLMAKSDLSDVSMFAYAAMALNPELNEKVLDQILQAGVEGIIEREKNKDQAVSKLSLMLRDFSSSPHIAHRFLREIIQLNLLPYIRTSKAGLRYLTYGALMADKELSRKWFLDIGQKTWEAKIRETSEDEAFWLLWNLFQVEPALACPLANVAEIRDKIARTPHGVGLLAFCGGTVKNVAIILPQLPDSLAEPWETSELALTFKALCLPDLREAALHVRANLDLTKVKETFQNAAVLEHTKELFMKILSEFEELN